MSTKAMKKVEGEKTKGEKNVEVSEMISLKDYPIDCTQDIRKVDMQTMEDANMKVLKSLPKQEVSFFRSAIGDRINAELKAAKEYNLNDRQFALRNSHFALVNMILYFTFHNFGRNVADMTRQYSYVSVKISNGWDQLEGVAWQTLMNDKREKRDAHREAQIVCDPITTLNNLDTGFKFEIDNEKSTKAHLIVKATPGYFSTLLTPPRQIAMKLLSAP